MFLKKIAFIVAESKIRAFLGFFNKLLLIFNTCYFKKDKGDFTLFLEIKNDFSLPKSHKLKVCVCVYYFIPRQKT